MSAIRFLSCCGGTVYLITYQSKIQEWQTTCDWLLFSPRRAQEVEWCRCPGQDNPLACNSLNDDTEWWTPKDTSCLTRGITLWGQPQDDTRGKAPPPLSGCFNCHNHSMQVLSSFAKEEWRHLQLIYIYHLLEFILCVDQQILKLFLLVKPIFKSSTHRQVRMSRSSHVKLTLRSPLHVHLSSGDDTPKNALLEWNWLDDSVWDWSPACRRAEWDSLHDAIIWWRWCPGNLSSSAITINKSSRGERGSVIAPGLSLSVGRWMYVSVQKSHNKAIQNGWCGPHMKHFFVDWYENTDKHKCTIIAARDISLLPKEVDFHYQCYLTCNLHRLRGCNPTRATNQYIPCLGGGDKQTNVFISNLAESHLIMDIFREEPKELLRWFTTHKSTR